MSTQKPPAPTPEPPRPRRPHGRAQRAVQQRRQALAAATAVVWALALAASFGRFRLAAKAPLTVALQTTPAVVRLTVDREPLFNGAHVQTPLKLNMAPGTHRLKIHRDGYVAHLVSVTGSAGDTRRVENVVLEREPGVQLVPVEVVADKGAYVVDVDDGLARGATPLGGFELTAGPEHKLVVYAEDGSGEPLLVCRFTPSAEADEAEPHRIKLQQKKAGGLRATGCERGRSKKGR